MPLIDLQTNLRDLKYGDFGVEPPLVTKDINNPPSRDAFAMEVTRRTDDLKRITTLLTTKPGLKHIVNQTALNALEKDIQSQGKGRSFLGKLVGGGWSSAKAIASMVAQVPVNGTGTHFVEGFMGKRGYLPKVQGHRSSLNGELINTKIEGAERQEQKGAMLTRFDDNGTSTSKISIVDAGDTTKDAAKKARKNIIKNLLNPLPPPPKTDMDKEYYSPGSVLQNHPGSQGLDIAYNTRADSLFKRVDLGFDRFNSLDTQSPKDKDGKTYGVRATDKITAKYPKAGKIGVVDGLDTGRIEEVTKDTFKDLIDFRFKIITPQSAKDSMPDVTILDFRAYLDSFNDSYAGEWSTFKYIGRAEDFHNYTGFNRTVSLSFKVAASSIDEMKPLYAKLNLLAGSTAPTYTGKNFMRGNFVALTVGGYLINEPGVIESVTFDWQTDYSWHTTTSSNISRNDKGEVEDPLQLPTVLDVAVTFKPVHAVAPHFGSKFIGSNNRLHKESNTDLDEVTVVAKLNKED